MVQSLHNHSPRIMSHADLHGEAAVLGTMIDAGGLSNEDVAAALQLSRELTEAWRAKERLQVEASRAVHQSIADAARGNNWRLPKD